MTCGTISPGLRAMSLMRTSSIQPSQFSVLPLPLRPSLPITKKGAAVGVMSAFIVKDPSSTAWAAPESRAVQ